MYPDINGENFHVWVDENSYNGFLTYCQTCYIGSEPIQTHNLLHVAILDKSLSPLGPAQPHHVIDTVMQCMHRQGQCLLVSVTVTPSWNSGPHASLFISIPATCMVGIHLDKYVQY